MITSSTLESPFAMSLTALTIPRFSPAMAESAPSQAALALTARAAPQAAAPENQFKIVRETLLSSDFFPTPIPNFE